MPKLNQNSTLIRRIQRSPLKLAYVKFQLIELFVLIYIIKLFAACFVRLNPNKKYRCCLPKRGHENIN